MDDSEIDGFPYIRNSIKPKIMKIVRNILAIVFGALLGGLVNSQIIQLSGGLIPLPEGVDPNDLESIKANIHLYQPIHFLFPFLAHAIGTLVGAVIAGLVAVSHKRYFSLAIGGFFLLGGITMVFLVPGPIWFSAVDVGLAYIPMGYLGYLIAIKIGGPEEVKKPDVLDI